MALIRQSSAAAAARDALVLDLGDLKRQGEAIQARARAAADQILADARSEQLRILKQVTEEGRAEGFARGLEEGRRQGREEGLKAALAEHKDRLAALEKSWSGALEQFNAVRSQIEIDARHDILTVAVRMGEMITKRALALDPSSVVEQLGEALAIVSRATRGSVTVHPDDLPVLRDAMPAVLLRFGEGTHLDLVPDDTIDRGGCILRTHTGGEVDATIPTQLARIVETLLPASGPAPPPEPAP